VQLEVDTRFQKIHQQKMIVETFNQEIVKLRQNRQNLQSWPPTFETH